MINKWIGMGRLTADPELRQTQSGVSVVRFSIAIDRPYQKDKEKQADFIRCTAWRNTAEFISRYFSKGKMIIVEGALHNNDYTDTNGTKHYSMDVQVDNVSFGESKGAQGDAVGTAIVEMTPGNTTAAQPTAQNSVGDLSGFEEILSDGETPF